jgi:2-phosphoglycerate kinase
VSVDELRDRLRHVRWLGGGTGAGKSTIARRLAGEHGLRLYGTDEAIRPHVARSTIVRHPLMHAFLAMDMDERWLNRSPAEMLRTFHGFRGEGFEMIIEDLLALPASPPILVEGFRLLPRLVAPLLGGPNRAVWLAATPEFRRAAFHARGTTLPMLAGTSDPLRALENLLARDALFTAEMVREARTHGLAVVDVDSGLGVDALTARVSEALGLTAGR